ncbi:hypothetical protein Tco_0834378 [Tanacetum coccineum]
MDRMYWEDTQFEEWKGQAGVGHWPLALRPFVFLDLLTKILAQMIMLSRRVNVAINFLFEFFLRRWNIYRQAHGTHMGLLPPVVFRETDPGKLKPLSEVYDKGKIRSRRTSASTEPSVHENSSFLYVELGLSDSDMESDEEVPPVVKSGAQDEGQTGPNPGNDIVSQPQSTLVHAEPNLEHTNENLKLTADEPVIPEEPASSTRTLSSL